MLVLLVENVLQNFKLTLSPIMCKCKIEEVRRDEAEHEMGL